MKKSAWEKFGVSLPNGTQLLCSYAGQQLMGEIREGKWHIGGAEYGSPTTAAVQNLVTKAGYPTMLNGWNIWKVKRPDDATFVELRNLRSKAMITPRPRHDAPSD